MAGQHGMLDQSCVLEGVQLSELIGSGSFAKVYKGVWKGIDVAVKQLHEIFSDAGPQQREGLTRTFHRELAMNMKLRHPNIIQFLGVASAVAPARDDNGLVAARSTGSDFPMMVMELMHCTLDKKLAEYRETGRRMPFYERVDVAADIAAALVYLHGKETPIAHRDLAPKNVLLSSSGTAKICDLGVAKWVNSSLNNTPGPGTLPYMPPEVRIGTSYSPVAVDVYSFGVTLLEMCCGLEPKPKDFAQMTSPDGSCQLVPEKMRREKSFAVLLPSHPLMTTIEQCLLHVASKRPTAMQLLTTLRELKKGESYCESKRTSEEKHNCSLCDAKDEELDYLRRQLEEKEEELSRLYEVNKTLENFRDDQLRLFKFKLRMAAKEGEKYQLLIQEMQEELDEQVQTNRQLEMTNSHTKDINHLLKQKVEMDSHLRRSSTHPRYPNGERLEKSTSVRCLNEQKPIPKPRKRKGSEPTTADNMKAEATKIRPHSLYKYQNVSTSESSLPGLKLESADDEMPAYLQLDALAMVKDQEKATVCVEAQKRPDSLTEKRRNSYESPDDPIYIKLPVSEPPTPPPRNQEFKFSRRSKNAVSLHSPFARPNRLSVIDERDESIKSPNNPTTPHNQPLRATQSVRSPRKGEKPALELPRTNTLEPPRPTLGRQNSRGDVLISEVLTTVKAKNPTEISAKKGELVKVTNSVLEKKLCVAVKTNGESGTIRKKHLERVSPVEIPYDFANPALSNRKGVFSHVGQCSSHNNTWISPVESGRILIIPSSIHSGDVGLLVKMTDYLLCCTDDERESHFEIDLHEQRLLKLSGYVMQCHSEGSNGAPLHWKLEGSHNGRSWSHLSEESGDYFSKNYANFFPVTNPMPCRYFRLTQLGKSSARNFRFCLSGLELYGHLFSSVVEERYTRRIFTT